MGSNHLRQEPGDRPFENFAKRMTCGGAACRERKNQSFRSPLIRLQNGLRFQKRFRNIQI